jgi:protease I
MEEGSIMGNELNGKRVAFIATDGVEQVELTEPWRAVQEAGGSPVLVSPKPGEIQGFVHHDKGRTFPVDRTFDSVNPADFDGLVIPGGVINPDRMRMDQSAVKFVRSFVDHGLPVAAICHGPWMLVEADAVRGRTVTSWPSLQTDIRNAGGTWVDRALAVDGKLITSRKPDDLEAFCPAVVELVAGGTPSEA